MGKKIMFVLACFLWLSGFSQSNNLDSLLKVHKFQKDSTLRAAIHADSVRIDKQFMETEKWDRLSASALHPVLNVGEFSGVIPVKDPTEIPDPNLDYKFLFELTSLNPDSAAKDVDYGLTEVARVINLHVASGIPLKKISVVIVVHGPALKAFGTNAYYNEQFKMDNPNIKVVEELKKLGTKFIACGQAMAFLEVKRENLLPDVKVSITAQTVISSYQLKGYLLWWGGAGKH